MSDFRSSGGVKQTDVYRVVARSPEGTTWICKSDRISDFSSFFVQQSLEPEQTESISFCKTI